MSNVLQRVRGWAKALKRQVMMLWFSYRHPQTPWLPKVVAIIVVAYALSPIDLIPDFIPILGYLDDVILLPLGIWIVIKLMPAAVLEECRQLTLAWEKTQQPRPVSRVAAIVIILLWLALLAGLWKFYTRY
ncbi:MULTISPECIES: YkvA family protein [Pseudomonas]|uniref:YkvA family protein n=1 Tax=Pseudomonas TaxID=286 RepID=UPI0002556EA8|nr:MULTISPECIES: YkvA family protein [Pseudomonas]